jgi:hypothetical protein
MFLRRFAMFNYFMRFGWLGLFLLPGCSSYEISSSSGVLMLDGQPYQYAILMFYAEGSEKSPGMAETDADGKFSWETLGVADGRYKVIVFQSDDPTLTDSRPLPEIYSDLSTSPLMIEVPTNEDVMLELKSE